jgi:hypothetical protein
MSNSDQPKTNNEWRQINLKWWQINVSLWFLVGLLFLYFRLPTTADLTRNIIVGGLIFALIAFLGVAVPKVVMSSLTTALSQMRNSLITEISSKLEDVVNKAREEREEERKELIQTIAGGPIVQGLTSNMKREGHEDLELYRFLGLKGEEEDNATFHNKTFQDFDIKGSNQNAVYFFWANTATTPSSEINAQVYSQNKFLTVSFNTHSIGGANIAIRASSDVARIRENRMRYLCFDIRLRQDDKSDSDNVEIGFRIVNGWLQHWEYSTMSREGYIKLLLQSIGTRSSDENTTNWETFRLDLENPDLWHLFPSDGNYLYGPKSLDFSVIASIIFEVGCRSSQKTEGALALKPGPGKGKFDLRNIRLSQHMEGNSIY